MEDGAIAFALKVDDVLRFTLCKDGVIEMAFE